MGLFDRFRSAAPDTKNRKSSPASKWADRMERRAQNYDRQEAIQALSDMGSVDAVELLLKRFTFHIDPSITDQEEKDSAFRGVVKAGAAAIEPVRAFGAKAESLAWPMKIMKELVGDEPYVDELLRWLAAWDTEYARVVDPKVQLLVALEERRDPRIAVEVERFLEDVNEPARFHAVATLLAQQSESTAPALGRLLASEESVRVRTRIAEGLAATRWSLPLELREDAARALPQPYTLDAAGRVVPRGRS
jgi:HEAT repeat protein